MSGVPSRPPPPKPVSKPGRIKVVRAMYRYEAQYGDELTFDEGDTLYILSQENTSWWRGKCNGREGLIPSNYVEESTESIDNPLHEAAKRGNMSFLRECLNNKVSVNSLDKAGSTPIHWAAHGGHIEVMKALLAISNCEFNVQNKLGDTPLHSAAWKGHVEAARLLLDKGAYTDIRNKEGKTARDLAKEPATAALLDQVMKPRVVNNDYGDEEDSD